MKIKLPIIILGKYQSDLYYCAEFPSGILANEYNKLKKCEGVHRNKHYYFAYHRTINGAIAMMFCNQVGNSKQRNHKKPQYSKLDLYNWIITQPNVVDLFANWIENGFKTDDKPSAGGIDNKECYFLENLSLIPWGENKAKIHEDQKSGKLRASVALTPVIMYDLKGKKVKDFISQHEARRHLNEKGFPKATTSPICECCKGKRNSAYKHKWKYANKKEIL